LEEQQEMEYPVSGLDAAHELWKNALGQANAHLYKERQTLLLAITSASTTSSNVGVDMADIDAFFKLKDAVRSYSNSNLNHQQQKQCPTLTKVAVILSTGTGITN
jgi:hypothetical protein